MFGGGGGVAESCAQTGGGVAESCAQTGGGRVAESCAQTAEEIKESAWEFHSIMFPGALG